MPGHKRRGSRLRDAPVARRRARRACQRLRRGARARRAVRPRRPRSLSHGGAAALAWGGADVEGIEGEALLFLTDRDPLLANGGSEFDPDHLLDAIKGLFTATVEAGYKGLRLSADVPWLTRDVPGGERAMEFEAKADELVNVPGVPLLAICQYRLGDLDPEDSLAILERHPLTLVGGRVHQNEAYISR
ncbi:MAG: hypothetical protein CYG60_19775 [Actinobacteria bacterium]|nr:MAG: hypothetical protein CYG60_19775 [Actinomycetota bacterium]